MEHTAGGGIKDNKQTQINPELDYWKNVSSPLQPKQILILFTVSSRHQDVCAGSGPGGWRGIGEISKGIFSIIFSIDQSRNGVTNLIDKLRLIY